MNKGSPPRATPAVPRWASIGSRSLVVTRRAYVLVDRPVSVLAIAPRLALAAITDIATSA